jgi:hypothetical protein
MSPVAQLIAMSQRRHDRLAHIKRNIMRELDRQALDMSEVEYSDEQFAYDKKHLKIDGREG